MTFELILKMQPVKVYHRVFTYWERSDYVAEHN